MVQLIIRAYWQIIRRLCLAVKNISRGFTAPGCPAAGFMAWTINRRSSRAGPLNIKYIKKIMAVVYQIIDRLQLVYARLIGTVDAEALARHFKELNQDARYIQPMKKLVDCRLCDDYRVSTADEQKLASLKEVFADKFQNERCAIVAPGNLLYGSNRAFQEQSFDSVIETMVFKNINDAVAWLQIDINYIDLDK